MAPPRQMASRPKVLPLEPPADTPDDDEQIAADEANAAAQARKNRRPPAPAPTPKPPSSAKTRPLKSVPSMSSSSSSKKSAPATAAPGVAHDGAGLLLGMVAYALFLAYLNYGWAGVRAWLAAKFLNRDNAPATPTPVAPTGPAGSGPNGNFPATPNPPVQTPGAPYNSTLPN